MISPSFQYSLINPSSVLTENNTSLDSKKQRQKKSSIDDGVLDKSKKLMVSGMPFCKCGFGFTKL
jgi:hypothetical protein